MSISHTKLFNNIKKTHIPFNKDVLVDYEAIRKNGDNKVIKKPKNVNVKIISNEYMNGEYIFKESNKEDKIIIYIHGGGFCNGSSKSRRFYTYYLANKSNYNVYSIDYPLSPENRFPVAMNACLKAYKYLLDINVNKEIIIIGDSAGGNILLSTLLKARDEFIKLPDKVILLSPVTQVDMITESYIKNESTDCMVDRSFLDKVHYTYLNDYDDTKNIYVSPLYATYDNFPNTLIVASDSEALLDDSLLLHEKIKSSKLILGHKLMHAYPVFIMVKEARKCMKKIFKYINKK